MTKVHSRRAPVILQRPYLHASCMPRRCLLLASRAWRMPDWEVLKCVVHPDCLIWRRAA